MRVMALVALFLIPVGCAPSPDGNFMTPVISTIFHTTTPDIMGCINRGPPWAWDKAARQCVELTPQQSADLHKQEADAWNREIEQRQPGSPETKETIRQFCARATSIGCAMYRNQAANCDAMGGNAYTARSTYLFWRRQMPHNLAISSTADTTKDWYLADLAGSAPEDMTADEFRARAVRACLRNAAQ
jgi:hypothetical protein